MRGTTTLTCCVLGVITLFAALGTARQEATEEATAAAGTVHVVAPGDLLLSFDQEGRVDSAARLKIRVDPEEYRGPLEVTEVFKRQGRVARDDELLRFDTTRLEEELHKARESLADAKSRLDLAREERRIQVEAGAIRLERAQRAKINADHELEIWDKYNSQRMLTASELGVQGRENSLADQKEELAQLEAMYEGTRLDSATKEIVLERARRNVTMSEQWLTITRNDDVITRTYRHGDQDRNVREDARHRAMELEHTRANSRIGEVRKELEVLSLERQVREGAQRLSRLESDWSRLTVTSPADGIMTAIDLQVGDTASGQQVLAELIDPTDLIVDFSATATDLRVIAEGADVALTLPAFPEVELTGTVRELSAIGTKSGDATHFQGVIAVDGTHPMLRVGLRCRARAEKALTGVLLLPAKAVKEKDGRATCFVWSEGEAVEREIRLGARNDEMVQIVSGLTAGEQVLLEEPKDEAASAAPSGD